ncbi:MAG TPA: ATP-dependent DNA ligase [Terriglobales bacterium]|nr:ATP-dependent DNA ligase [Terriglobales bacterium]
MPRTKNTTSSKKAQSKVGTGAVSPETLEQAFPPIRLPIQPPYPPTEARSVAEIPTGPGWLYEPKWDGFRCLVFREGDKVLLQSKAGQTLARYFPELVAGIRALPQRRFVLDGEIVIFSGGHLSFDDLLLRIHPAESRIRKLSAESPATLMCFDLLVDSDGESLIGLPLAERRRKLVEFFQKLPKDGIVRLSPASRERSQAENWMKELATMGLDGIVAKRLDEPYRSGERTAMVKIKRIRTADCVVGGFRYAEKGGGIGSLLLGLYNEQGLLDHVGFTSSFNQQQRRDLKKILEPQIGPPGFTGHAPGGPSRWSTKRSTEWQPLKPKLVCEVQYDHFSGSRFRHGTKFLRWRPEKKPRQCTFEQVKPGSAKRGSGGRSFLRLAG